MTLRSLLLRSHLIVGCLAAPILFVAGISGAVVVFEDPYADRTVDRALMHVAPGAERLPLDALRDSLRRRTPGAEVKDVSYPTEARNTYLIGVSVPGSKGGATYFVDPWRGSILGNGQAVRRPLRWAHDLHTHLMVSGKAGQTLVAWGAVALVFLSLSGLWLWWPGKILRVRRGTSLRRATFELHNVLGGTAWVFMLVFGLTGIIVHWEEPAQQFLFAISGGSRPMPSPPPATTCASQPLTSLDAIARNIETAMPGAHATSIQFGDRATDYVRARLKYPEDKTPAGRSIVLVERCTAKVVYALSTRDAPFAWRWTRMWNRSVHTGDVYGWPTRILAVLAALLLPMMALTGPMIWWMRRRKLARG